VIYYITLEVRTKKALGTQQQDKLRDATLEALDEAFPKLPYSADVVTASIGGEEAS
jgi:hypothetical protein